MQGVRILIATDRQPPPAPPGPWRGHHVRLAARGSDALALVRGEPFDLVVIDLPLPPEETVALLVSVKRARPGTLVVVRPREATVDLVLAAFRRGAWDVRPQPLDGEAVRELADRAVAVREAGERRRRMSEELETERLRVDDLRRRLASARSDLSGRVAGGATLREVERRRILEVLRATGGNKKRAAAELGIHRSTLYAKLERYGIAGPAGARDRAAPEATGTGG